MPLTLATKDEMLRAAFGGSNWLGLLREDGSEEADENYHREMITLDAEAPSDRLLNVEEVRFPPYAASSTVAGWILYGNDGQERGREALAPAKKMEPRERLVFEPGDIVVRVSG